MRSAGWSFRERERLKRCTRKAMIRVASMEQECACTLQPTRRLGWLPEGLRRRYNCAACFVGLGVPAR